MMAVQKAAPMVDLKAEKTASKRAVHWVSLKAARLVALTACSTVAQ
jgi:hypothetical protein